MFRIGTSISWSELPSNRVANAQTNLNLANLFEKIFCFFCRGYDVVNFWDLCDLRLPDVLLTCVASCVPITLSCVMTHSWHSCVMTHLWPHVSRSLSLVSWLIRGWAMESFIYGFTRHYMCIKWCVFVPVIEVGWHNSVTGSRQRGAEWSYCKPPDIHCCN